MRYGSNRGSENRKKQDPESDDLKRQLPTANEHNHWRGVTEKECAIVELKSPAALDE
jgi:hypothetical protein